MADFKPGTMDVTEHRKTFGKFINWMVGGSIAVIIVLIFLAIVGT